MYNSILLLFHNTVVDNTEDKRKIIQTAYLHNNVVYTATNTDYYYFDNSVTILFELLIRHKKMKYVAHGTSNVLPECSHKYMHT